MSDNEMEVDLPPTQTNDEVMDAEPTKEAEKDPDGEFHDEDGGIHIHMKGYESIYIAPPPPPSLTFECEGPRLIITHIENENFKSYQGKRTLGPFHKSFTSIVGPNGSGKSNVIDSMLFVFGYRANKIRLKKISHLIHNSENFPDLRTCKVRVFFQEIIDEGDEKFRVVENSQFYVTRTANKDNSSHYDINGKKCQFKEVGKMLRAKGVDLDHNRFLILQGEVEQIALMKPIGQSENDTGMLEFLEDIIGSSRFKEPIDSLKQRTTELDEFRSEKLNRVKLVEKEKDELEKPMKEALEYLNAENEITQKKNLLYQKYITTFQGKIEETNKKKAEFEANCQELLEKLGAITAKKEKREGQFKELTTEYETVSKEFESSQEAFKKHELTDSKLMEEMKSLNNKRKKTKTLLAKEKENLEQYEKIPEKNKDKISECQDLQKKLEDDEVEAQKKYDAALASLKTETQEYQEQKEKYETSLISLRKDENEKEGNYNVAKSELDILLSTEQKENCLLEQLEQKYNSATAGLGDKKAKLEEHSKAIPKLKKKIPELEQDVKRYNNEYEQISKKINGMNTELEETRTKQSASRSQGKVIDSIMKQKKTGSIPGIFGRLGDLGAIDKKYDVAISTAAGGALETIIVDSVDTAKKCIEYLKRYDIGRGNFYALDKAQKWKEKLARIKTPENAPRLVDLIEVEDEELRPAFYQYLRDTLVADDMNQARRIAFGARRYRVVTLSGELIETSGAMSGGGREKMSGKMGTQIAEKRKSMGVNLDALERKVQEERARLSEIETQLREAEAALSQTKRELNARELEAKKLEREVSAFDEAGMKKQIKDQQKIVQEAKADPKKIKELEKRAQELLQIFEEASEAARGTKENVNKLNKKIKEIHSTKVKSVQAKLDGARSQLDKVKKEITRLEVEIKTSERNLKKAQDKCEAYESEVTEAENKMREMKAQREALVEDGEKIKNKLQELEQRQEEISENLKVVKEKLKKYEEEETKHKSEKIEFDEATEKFTTAIKENTKTIQHWKREITKLKLEDIPGEEKADLKQFSPEELNECDMDQAKMELNVMEENLATKRPDLKAIEEFKRKEAVYLERVSELDEITQKRDRARKRHDDLRKTRLNDFMAGFGTITAKLKEMYQMITLGGDAELELVDSLDPFTEGIVFSVRPPKKSWKNISNLSGGEKTLSSLALVFALHYYKPTPLYVMDEIDAALDFKNVSIVANYIKDRTKNAQFIIISLRSNMFELADRLVGIYKTYNCTKSVTINPGKISQENNQTQQQQQPMSSKSKASLSKESTTVLGGQKDPQQPPPSQTSSTAAVGASN